MEKRDHLLHLRRREVKARHFSARPPFPDHRPDLVALLVGEHKLRLRQVRTALSAHRVAPVTEGAVLVKQRIAPHER
jgi:hypothetical protein